MNKQLNLAVAGAVLALSAMSANAGIIIPAGEWTLDIGGVVNTFYTNTKVSGNLAGLHGGLSSTGTQNVSNITTGLLPNVLSFSGKTRQNDLDVGFTIAINPGASTVASANQGAQQENRQAFVTFGDASWGSVLLGKNIGIYAQDAILNDMTLLGVGAGAGALAGNTTTIGRIGSGFMYADWKSQIAYSTPNWNGFTATAGVTQSWGDQGIGGNAVLPVVAQQRGGAQPAFEAKASYAFAGDVAGKVWVSGISQNMERYNDRANAMDIGVNVNAAGFGATAYYNKGKGTGSGLLFAGAYDAAGQARDSNDWYVQGTYTIPTVATKLGVSYGESKLKGNGAGDAMGNETRENNMLTVGAYHPLTKHLNLVAEYSNAESKQGALSGKSKTASVGAILFF